MGLLDWFFVGFLSVATFCLLLAVFSFIYFLSIRDELTKVSWRRRPKNKQRRKMWLKERHMLEKGKKKNSRNVLLFLVVGAICTGSAFYSRYYQLTNLTSEDSKIVVQGYFLTEEIEGKINSIQEGVSVEKLHPQLQEVSSLLVSYSNKPISSGLSKQGTKLLMRYRVMMRDVGANLSSLRLTDLEQRETMTAYLKDISKLKHRQQDVFTYFKVNESALKNKQ
ncbi:hypothetical protein DOK67_0002322 [Enterococcus sp. DIV0212c]|uniref:hypothetical protein n=1 Tax=Enterococcus sp. DIV0212c TaxID=2230867 RepID=UPI001A9B346A|nr:hypothetical protein [Enterococcus sp. DIV0212c]MBO1355272.1 hypothetical protein [Enterococcus sp. DIV0212c]